MKKYVLTYHTMTVTRANRNIAQKGKGFLKRSAGQYPPSVRKLLGEVGTEPVTSLEVYRAPIQSFVKQLLGFISGGTYDKAVKNSNYDKAFHLSVIINGKYTLDKQAVVSFSSKIPSGGEGRTVTNIPEGLTIQQLIDNTKIRMGPSNFSNYDSKTNNCQIFIKNVLEANGLWTPELETFVLQNAEEIFSRMPAITEKIAHTLTETGAVADKLIQGEGWRSFYQRHTKGKKFSSRQSVNDHMKDLSRRYRESNN